MVLKVESPVIDVEIQELFNGFNNLNVEIATTGFGVSLPLLAEKIQNIKHH